MKHTNLILPVLLLSISFLLPAMEIPKDANPSVAELETILLNGSLAGRREAAARLADLAAPEAMTALFNGMASDLGPYIAADALEARITRDKTGMAVRIIPGLKHAHYRTRLLCAYLLGICADTAASAPLAQVLADSNFNVRLYAAEALRLSGDKDAVPELIQAMDDSYPLVRLHAAAALGKIKDPRAVTVLIARLTDKDASINAARALKAIGGPEAETALAAVAPPPAEPQPLREPAAALPLPLPPVSAPRGTPAADVIQAQGFALTADHYTIKSKGRTIEGAVSAAGLSIKASAGEYEPACLTVFAGKDLNRVVLTVSAAEGPGGSIPSASFEIRNEKAQTTGSGQAEVARTLLYPALKPLAIKAGGNLRFWITVKVPTETAAGTYTGKVTVSGEGLAAELPLTVQVYAFKHGKLPGKHVNMIGTPEEPVYFKDCAEHGMTEICAGAGDVFQEGPNGELRLPDLDKHLRMAKEAGLGETFVAYCPPIVPTSKVKNSSHIFQFRHYKHTQRMLKMARAYREICRAEDLPEVIWYIFDEPGKHDTKQHGPVRNREAQIIYPQVRELPGARTYLTMGHEEAEEFGDSISIHCYGGAPSPEDIKRSRECGAEVWRYSNGISMGTNPLYSRWAMGLFPWACGWDGTTSWTYPVVQGSIGEDGKPITMAVWESIREGVDDWYYILTLEGLIAAQPDQPVAQEAGRYLDAVRASIDVRKESTLPFTGEQMDIIRHSIALYIEKLMSNK